MAVCEAIPITTTIGPFVGTPFVLPVQMLREQTNGVFQSPVATIQLRIGVDGSTSYLAALGSESLRESTIYPDLLRAWFLVPASVTASLSNTQHLMVGELVYTPPGGYEQRLEIRFSLYPRLSIPDTTPGGGEDDPPIRYVFNFSAGDWIVSGDDATLSVAFDNHGISDPEAQIWEVVGTDRYNLTRTHCTENATTHDLTFTVPKEFIFGGRIVVVQQSTVGTLYNHEIAWVGGQSLHMITIPHSRHGMAAPFFRLFELENGNTNPIAAHSVKALPNGDLAVTVWWDDDAIFTCQIYIL